MPEPRYEYETTRDAARARELAEAGYERYATDGRGFHYRRDALDDGAPLPAADDVELGVEADDEAVAALGSHAARLLLAAFGTLDAAARADDDALLAVDGVGPKTVTALRSLHPAAPAE